VNVMESPLDFRKVWALVRRDATNWASYKSQIVTTILTALVGIGSWGLNATFRNVAVPEYNTDYVSFLIIGILVSNLIMPLSQGIQRTINPWTLETILMTGIRTPTFVLGTVAFGYILSVVLFIPQMIIGIYIFGAHLDVNILSLIVAVLISSIIVFSLAIITTGIRIVTKVSDPVTWALNFAQQLLSGMTYPVQHLNDFYPGLSTISWFLPQTWIYHIVRLASLTDASLLNPSIAESFLITSAFAIVLFPLSFRVFRWGMRRAKRDGTLGWY
jgi:ABC-2 type transporter.